MTSWYIEEDCVATQELKPWWLTFICIALQSLLAFILFIRSGSNNNKQHSQKKKSCCFLVNIWRAFKSSKIFNYIVSTYQIWQIISVISILILDGIKFYNYINKHSKSSWINYNCFAAITINSPILVTLASNAATTNMWMNGAAYDATNRFTGRDQLAAQDAEAVRQAQAFQKALSNMFDIGRYKLKSTLSAWRQRMFFCLFWYLAFNGVAILYALPGIFIFGSAIWICYCCVMCCLCCIACTEAQEELNEMAYNALDEDLLDTQRNTKASINMDVGNIDGNKDEEDLPEISNCNAFIVVVMMPIFYTFSLIICPLMMINFYFGDSWTDSVIDTFNDRHWNEYWDHTKQSYEAKWKLCVSLLG